MAFVEELKPVPVRRLAWSIRLGPLGGETEGYRTQILYSDRAPKSILLYRKPNEGFFFPRVEILLALGFLFLGTPTTCTMLSRMSRDVVFTRKKAHCGSRWYAVK